MNQLLAEAVTEAPKFVSSVVLLALAWGVGQRLAVKWNLRQKRSELALSTARDFHELYGDFFATWKLWNYYREVVKPQALPGASRWEMLKRAAESEGHFEAMLVRLCCDRRLTASERVDLRDFRLLYQQLREAIRDDRPLSWRSSDHPDYQEFKRLAPVVAALAAGEALPPDSPRDASEALCHITSRRGGAGEGSAVSQPTGGN